MRVLAAGLALAIVLLTGCPEPDGPQAPSCEVEEEAPLEEAHALVDGDEWIGDNTLLSASGTGVMVGFTMDATNAITIRMTESAIFSVDEETGVVSTVDGDNAEDLYNDSVGADYEVGDSNRHGSDVTLVLDGETLHTSNADAEGFLRIAFLQDEDTGAVTMTGCGWFDAETQDHDLSATMTDLSFALPLQ